MAEAQNSGQQNPDKSEQLRKAVEANRKPGNNERFFAETPGEVNKKFFTDSGYSLSHAALEVSLGKKRAQMTDAEFAQKVTQFTKQIRTAGLDIHDPTLNPKDLADAFLTEDVPTQNPPRDNHTTEPQPKTLQDLVSSLTKHPTIDVSTYVTPIPGVTPSEQKIQAVQPTEQSLSEQARMVVTNVKNVGEHAVAMAKNFPTPGANEYRGISEEDAAEAAQQRQETDRLAQERRDQAAETYQQSQEAKADAERQKDEAATGDRALEAMGEELAKAQLGERTRADDILDIAGAIVDRTKQAVGNVSERIKPSTPHVETAIPTEDLQEVDAAIADLEKQDPEWRFSQIGPQDAARAIAAKLKPGFGRAKDAVVDAARHLRPTEPQPADSDATQGTDASAVDTPRSVAEAAGETRINNDHLQRLEQRLAETEQQYENLRAQERAMIDALGSPGNTAGDHAALSEKTRALARQIDALTFLHTSVVEEPQPLSSLEDWVTTKIEQTRQQRDDAGMVSDTDTFTTLNSRLQRLEQAKAALTNNSSDGEPPTQPVALTPDTPHDRGGSGVETPLDPTAAVEEAEAIISERDPSTDTDTLTASLSTESRPPTPDNGRVLTAERTETLTEEDVRHLKEAYRTVHDQTASSTQREHASLRINALRRLMLDQLGLPAVDHAAMTAKITEAQSRYDMQNIYGSLRDRRVNRSDQTRLLQRIFAQQPQLAELVAQMEQNPQDQQTRQQLEQTLDTIAGVADIRDNAAVLLQQAQEARDRFNALLRQDTMDVAAFTDALQEAETAQNNYEKRKIEQLDMRNQYLERLAEQARLQFEALPTDTPEAYPVHILVDPQAQISESSSETPSRLQRLSRRFFGSRE